MYLLIEWIEAGQKVNLANWDLLCPFLNHLTSETILQTVLYRNAIFFKFISNRSKFNHPKRVQISLQVTKEHNTGITKYIAQE